MKFARGATEVAIFSPFHPIFVPTPLSSYVSHQGSERSGRGDHISRRNWQRQSQNFLLLLQKETYFIVVQAISSYSRVIGVNRGIGMHCICSSDQQAPKFSISSKVTIRVGLKEYFRVWIDCKIDRDSLESGYWKGTPHIVESFSIFTVGRGMEIEANKPVW